MAIGTKPPAEVVITAPMVQELLEEQHMDLAHLPLTDIGEGWDNRLFRLGDELLVRLPRRAISAALIDREQRWLPRLSPQLPLPIPLPRRLGRPGCGFPWQWSITTWCPGETALVAPPADASLAAHTLGQFLRALHQPAPAEAPYNPWRSAPLGTRTDSLLKHLQQLGGLVARVAVLELWNRVLSAPLWPGPPLWIHGDLHPGNLLVSDGRLSAVIDFGDLAAGDPATDLSVMWMLLPPVTRPVFRASARGEFSPFDDQTLLRARGWALALGVDYLASSQDDEAMGTLGLATVDAALNDE